MHISVCTYVYIYTYIYASMYIYTTPCQNAPSSNHRFLHIYVFMHRHRYIHRHLQEYIIHIHNTLPECFIIQPPSPSYICIYAQTQTYTQIYTQIYTYIYIHTYTYISDLARMLHHPTIFSIPRIRVLHIIIRVHSTFCRHTYINVYL